MFVTNSFVRAVVCATAVSLVMQSSPRVIAAERKSAAATPAAEIEPAAGAVVDAEAAYFRGLKSFSVKTVVEVRAGSGSSQKFESTITLQKPNRVDLTVDAGENRSRLVSDGSALFIFDPNQKTYFKTQAPPSAVPVLQRFAPGLTALLGDDPRREILDNVQKITFAGEEKIGGATCAKLHFEQQNGDVMVWIEKGAQPLLRRLTFKLADKTHTEVDARFDEWLPEPKLPPDRFVFTPPEGATEIHPDRDAAKARAEAAKVPPIRVVPGAKLAEDDRRLHHAWCERVLIEPFKKRLKGEPWNATALAFVESAVDELDWASSRRQAAKQVAAGQALVSEGGADPLVRYLTTRLRYRVEHNRRLATAAYDALMKELDADASWPRALLCFIGKDAAAANTRGTQGLAELDRRTMEWTKAALKDGSYSPEDDVIFLKHQVNIGWDRLIENRFKEVAPIYAASDLPEWVKRTLQGYIEVKLAWEARGSGWGNSVTPEGWKGFGEHLARANAELRQAWKLRPDRPEAAQQMITVVMGGGAEAGETERDWFDRATAAIFDYWPAYTKLLYAYRPRWNGSHEKMLAFARACRETQRTDTDVPMIFTEAIDDIAAEYGDRREIYREFPELAGEIKSYYEVMMREPSRQADLDGWRGWLAVRTWAASDFATAADSLAKLNDRLPDECLHFLHGLGVDLPEVVADVAVRTGAGADDFAKADALNEKGDLARAGEAYRAAAKVAAEKAQPLIRSRLAVIDFERSLEGGDWVKLAPTPGLLDWSLHGGNWEADADGALVNRGDDERGLILFKGRVGDELEVRGEFEIVSPDRAHRTLGVALGYDQANQSTAGDDRTWLNCTVYQNGSTRPIASIFGSYFTTDLPQKPVTVQPVNQFFIHLHEGKVTYQLNGQAIFTDQPVPSEITVSPQGQLGFAARRFGMGNVTKIRHLEVRRLVSAAK